MRVLLWVLVEVVVSSSGHVVETPLGKVRGYVMTSRSGREFLAFKGLPYAKPPLKHLRFQPPKPVEPWRGVVDGRGDGPPCIQVSMFDPTRSVVGTEDCLYLAVFTSNISGHAPVMVHIHGGAHTSGTGQIFGPQYMMDEDIVMVKPNYRLGIFGFLSFENEDLPGNQGMKDQVEVLKWVQRNIASFGGNPHLVTLIGESSGGASVYNHIVSPLSIGLFHRAIAESGTSYSSWNLAPPGFAKANAQKLMKLIDCPKNSKDAIPCLLEKDAVEIVSKFKDFLEWQIDPPQNFCPVLEPPGPEAFLVGPVSRWKHSPVPLMLGLTSAEGLLRTAIMLQYETDFKWLSENFDSLAPISLIYFASSSKPGDITSKVQQYYLPNKEITMNDWVNLTTMYSDSWFTVGVLDGGNSHEGDVYMYYFDYLLTGKSLFPLPSQLQFGSFHCSDMSLIWNLSAPLVPNVETNEEINLSKRFIKVIESFMRFGAPPPEIKWHKWTVNDHNYLDISKEGFHPMKGNPIGDRYTFWKTLNYRDNYEKNWTPA